MADSNIIDFDAGRVHLMFSDLLKYARALGDEKSVQYWEGERDLLIQCVQELRKPYPDKTVFTPLLQKMEDY